MHSVDLLADALDNYQGSLILVSHDRYFISKTANKIWEIVDGKIVEFKGGYTEWVEWKERMALKEKTQGSKQEVKGNEKGQVPKQDTKVIKDKGKSNENEKIKKKLQRQFEELESKISDLKSEKVKAEEALADIEVYTNKFKFVEAEKKYKQVVDQLAALEPVYEKLFEDLMNIEN